MRVDSGYFYEIELVEVINKATITAVAEAFASAVVKDGECEAVGEAGAETIVCEDCVAKHRRCGGHGFDKVVGCCDEGYSCYKKSKRSRWMTCSSDKSFFVDRWVKHDCEA